MSNINSTVFALGERDTLAGIFASIRLHGNIIAAIKECISRYESQFGNDNPHATWVKNFIKESEKKSHEEVQ